VADRRGRPPWQTAVADRRGRPPWQTAVADRRGRPPWQTAVADRRGRPPLATPWQTAVADRRGRPPWQTAVADRRGRPPWQTAVADRRGRPPWQTAVADRRGRPPWQTAVADRRGRPPWQTAVADRRGRPPWQTAVGYAVADRRGRPPWQTAVADRRGRPPWQTAVADRRGRPPWQTAVGYAVGYMTVLLFFKCRSTGLLPRAQHKAYRVSRRICTVAPYPILGRQPDHAKQSKRKAKDLARVVTQPHRQRKRKNRAAREGLVSELLMSVAAVCPLVERADSSKVGQPDLVWLCGYGLVQMICTPCCCWRASHSILAISMVAQSMWDTFPQLKNQTVYMIFLLEKLN
jgi:hypothetical protein